MRVRNLILVLMVFCFINGVVWGQTVTTDGEDEGTGDGSNYNAFTVICIDQAVLNFTGFMEAGFDLYYQVFSGSQGTGGAISPLRQAAVNGTYTFSEIVRYNEGTTIAIGGFGSVYVAIAPEGNPDSAESTQYIDDIQDGCAQPQNPIGTSTTTDGSVPGGTTTTPAAVTSILSPFGGVVNPGYVAPPEDLVVIGSREKVPLPRQQTPGLIFAECNDFPVAEPGIIYDTDNVVIFWSWFADTEEQLIDHINNVNYRVAYYQVLPVPNVVRTEPQQINGNWWVFYYSQLGNLRPGQYYFEYHVTWNQAITDGFDDYGPGTATPLLNSGCGFNVLRNPENRTVSYARWPYFD